MVNLGEWYVVKVLKMNRIGSLAFGAAVLGLALGAGHLVQKEAGSDALARAASAPAPWDSPVVPKNIVTLSAGPVASGQPATLPAGQAVQATVAPPVAPATAAPATALLAPDADCKPLLSVSALPGALLDLSLRAPCAAGERVVLRHDGLALTARIADDGTLSTLLPALDRTGTVMVLMPDGARIAAAAPVDMEGIERFALQWQGHDALQLNAYEDGARHGEAGHVWSGNPGLPDPRRGGHMLILGDAKADLPLRAAVYSFPTDPTRRIALSVEAEVTTQTCATEILGETLHSRDGLVTVSDILFVMPGCDAVGDFLVLNNLLTGTTLAAAE